MAEGIVTDPREADVGSILGFGYAPYSGGAISFIDGMGLKAFVARAKALAAKYGPRFEPGEQLSAMAERNETFYGTYGASPGGGVASLRVPRDRRVPPSLPSVAKRGRWPKGRVGTKTGIARGKIAGTIVQHVRPRGSRPHPIWHSAAKLGKGGSRRSRLCERWLSSPCRRAA